MALRRHEVQDVLSPVWTLTFCSSLCKRHNISNRILRNVSAKETGLERLVEGTTWKNLRRRIPRNVKAVKEFWWNSAKNRGWQVVKAMEQRIRRRVRRTEWREVVREVYCAGMCRQECQREFSMTEKFITQLMEPQGSIAVRTVQ